MALLPENLSFSRKILPIIAVVGLLVAVVFIWNGLPDRELSEPENEPPRATGELANATRVAGAGLVEPSSEIVDIGTALSGLVSDLRVQPGDYVEKGQVLFTVDDRAVRASLQEANAAINEARAAIGEAQTARATAQQQLALYNQVEDSAAVSRAEVIRAEGDASAANSRLKLARARLSAAQARAGSARTELGRLTVRAPMAGEILAVNIRPGEYVSTQGGNGQPFIRMGQTRPLYIRVDIDESEAVRVDMGAPAIVSPRGAAGEQVEAKFVRAEPLVVPKTSLTNSASERVDVRVLQVLYQLPERASGGASGDGGLFRVGQQIDAFIPAKNASAKSDAKPADVTEEAAAQ
ncbi:efflux RND transporter periplasmic adaptor subunit [Pontixanthobacter aestiaquae]|uniref:Biotin/lipoyl-binding protein n=1 Tax=Pontixanthobacter aestiaquae TaxID=1509367 RepID=A0A844Z3C7_9SPHN|nr:efflux RND transporter periplasmic adaptor subunit [Pontixanthobacter aestiaquae]MDN3646580.1 efflux RND transporter periplasmic adaptor subunit [Pontixanthobacter aestiaquae]MXO82435.1 biotin/lipoyl-binding protein [Pontixanthobacter aestiaquae]